jgi:cell division protein FtsW (lipid II flippase)
MIYSAGVLNEPSTITQDIWQRQLAWLVLGLVVFSLISRVPLRWFEWAALPVFVAALFLLFATLIVGTGAGTAAGTKSFIQLGAFRFQPAEVAKIATVLAMARLLSMRKEVPQSLRELWLPPPWWPFPWAWSSSSRIWELP